MKYLPVIILIIPQLLLAQYENRTITVSGSARRAVTPDEIVLEVSYQNYEKSPDPMILQQQEADFKKIVNRYAIPQKDVVVQKIEASKSYYGYSAKRVRTQGSYRVTVRDTEVLNPLIGDLIISGASRVQIVDRIYNDMDSLKLEVTKQAIQLARNKAKMMVESQGGTLGNTISIKELGEVDQGDDRLLVREYSDTYFRMAATGAVSRAVGSADDQYQMAMMPVTVSMSVRVVYAME